MIILPLSRRCILIFITHNLKKNRHTKTKSVSLGCLITNLPTSTRAPGGTLRLDSCDVTVAMATTNRTSWYRIPIYNTRKKTISATFDMNICSKTKEKKPQNNNKTNSWAKAIISYSFDRNDVTSNIIVIAYKILRSLVARNVLDITYIHATFPTEVGVRFKL